MRKAFFSCEHNLYNLTFPRLRPFLDRSLLWYLSLAYYKFPFSTNYTINILKLYIYSPKRVNLCPYRDATLPKKQVSWICFTLSLKNEDHWLHEEEDNFFLRKKPWWKCVCLRVCVCVCVILFLLFNIHNKPRRHYVGGQCCRCDGPRTALGCGGEYVTMGVREEWGSDVLF